MKNSKFSIKNLLLVVITNLVFVCALNAQTAGKISKVVLDAGHGGHDPGNRGTGRYKISEKDIALDVTLMVGAYIKEYFPDVEVIYTRDKDVFVELRERTRIANDANADLFISIHCNSYKPKPDVHGTETFVMGLKKAGANLRVAQAENAARFLEENHEVNYAGFNPDSPEEMIALTMRQNAYLENSLMLSAEIQDQFTNRVSRHNRGVKQDVFYVISYTTMPSVLVELGFLTNKKEEEFLMSDKGKDYMASAIFRAFRSYKEKIEGINSKVITEDVEKNNICFKVQFLSSKQKVAEQKSNFKGLNPVDFYEADGWFKYTYGKTSDYGKIREMLKEVKQAGYNKAFVVAFNNNERIPVKDAVKQLKQSN